LDGLEFALQSCQLGCLGIVSAYQKCRWPEHDDCRRRGNDVACALPILNAGKFSSPLRDPPGFFRKLSAVELFVGEKRHVGCGDVLRPLRARA
jgi:hypothetical protein